MKRALAEVEARQMREIVELGFDSVSPSCNSPYGSNRSRLERPKSEVDACLDRSRGAIHTVRKYRVGAENA
jgi:hypothetical protein